MFERQVKLKVNWGCMYALQFCRSTDFAIVIYLVGFLAKLATLKYKIHTKYHKYTRTFSFDVRKTLGTRYVDDNMQCSGQAVGWWWHHAKSGTDEGDNSDVITAETAKWQQQFIGRWKRPNDIGRSHQYEFLQCHVTADASHLAGSQLCGTPKSRCSQLFQRFALCTGKKTGTFITRVRYRIGITFDFWFPVSKQQIVDSALMSSGMRRTASLDALYMKPSWKIAHQFQLQQQLQQQASAFTILQLDKATQTEESSIGGCDGSITFSNQSGHLVALTDMPGEGKIEKIVRQRLQRVQRGGEHSVSSQTLSPSHSKCLTSIEFRMCGSFMIAAILQYFFQFYS